MLRDHRRSISLIATMSLIVAALHSVISGFGVVMSLVAKIGKEWEEYDKLHQCILILSLSLLVIVEFVGFVIF